MIALAVLVFVGCLFYLGGGKRALNRESIPNLMEILIVSVILALVGLALR